MILKSMYFATRPVKIGRALRMTNVFVIGSGSSSEKRPSAWTHEANLQAVVAVRGLDEEALVPAGDDGRRCGSRCGLCGRRCLGGGRTENASATVSAVVMRAMHHHRWRKKCRTSRAISTKAHVGYGSSNADNGAREAHETNSR